MSYIVEWLHLALANKNLLQLLAELLLPCFSVVGVFMSTSPNAKTRFIGFISGIISQFFWFYAAIVAYNLGMFINVCFFTVLWIYRAAQLYKIKNGVDDNV